MLASTMPFTPTSLAAELKREMEEAFAALEPDGEAAAEIATLPTGLDGAPKWNTHSLRRGGAKKARDLMPVSKAMEEDINRHFGWIEEYMRGGKKRQIAYAGTLSATRRIAITKHF